MLAFTVCKFNKKAEETLLHVNKSIGTRMIYLGVLTIPSRKNRHKVA